MTGTARVPALRPVLRRLHRIAIAVFQRLPARVRLAIIHLVQPSYAIGVICVIERQDGALLLARPAYRSRWNTVGGFVDRGEGAVDAAHREAGEEIGMGIEIDGDPLVIVAPEGRRIHVVFRCRLAGAADPEEVRSTTVEIDDVRWFQPDELPLLQPETTLALELVERAKQREGVT